MSLFAALVLAAATARVEAVTLTTVDSQLAVRVAVSGEPGTVTVHREGGGARISVMDVELGGQFAGGSRFAWTPAHDFDPALLAGPTRLDRIEVAASASQVSLLLSVPPDVSIAVRRDPLGLLLVFQEGPATAPPPAPVEREPVVPAESTEPPPEPVTPLPEPVEPPPTPSADTAELARSLFPAAAVSAASAAQGATGQASVSELYSQLFPAGPPQTAPEVAEPEAEPMASTGGVPFGPFRVRARIEARYVDADTYIEGPDSRTRARYLEVVPRIAAEAIVSDGRLFLEYMPSLRAFSNIDDVNSNTHRATAGIDLPVGPSVIVRVKDSFVSGVLDTRDADPGGEYFYDLGRFRRNTLDAGVSALLNPRLSLELGATASALRFQEESSFFDHDSRLASAGLGYELTPNLKTTVLYSYDTVPTPEERPEVASRAHNAQLTFIGDILPLVSGRLMVGYRDQKSPNAGEGGRRYTGFTMGGTVTKQFSPESDVTLFVNRSTPVSAFEDNAFYVFTAVQGSGRFPLPLEFQLRGGLGYQWNDYRTVSTEIGEPRADRIFGYHVGLRRAVFSRLFLSVAYRREERRSNLERFDTDSDGFFVQLEWDIFGYAP